MLTPERIAELRKVAEEVIRKQRADTQYQEELKIHGEQGPNALAMYHIGRDVMDRKAHEAKIAQSVQQAQSQKADEALAQAIVAPLIKTLPAASITPAGKQPATSGNVSLPGRVKARRKSSDP